MKSIALIGSGPSLAEISPAAIRADCIIAVNGAIGWLMDGGARADIWFTLDPCDAALAHGQLALEAGARAIVAAPLHAPLPKGFERWDRRAGTAQLATCTAPLGSAEWWFHRFSCVAGLSDRWGVIHTGNSLYGALGLAYLIGPERIGIFGLDANYADKVTGGAFRAWKHLPMLFESALPQLKRARIDVVNGSARSNVTCFERQHPRDAAAWLAGD